MLLVMGYDGRDKFDEFFLQSIMCTCWDLCCEDK